MPQDKNYIAQARTKYCSDDLEIDDTPKMSHGEGGAWVSAWVWITDEEADKLEKKK